jgi:hypothetical protein
MYVSVAQTAVVRLLAVVLVFDAMLLSQLRSFLDLQRVLKRLD